MSKLQQYLEAIEINTMDPIRVLNSRMDPRYSLADFVLAEIEETYTQQEIERELKVILDVAPSGLVKAVLQIVKNTKKVFDSQWMRDAFKQTPRINNWDRFFLIDIHGEYSEYSIIVTSTYDIAKLNRPGWEITEIDAETTKQIIKDRKDFIKRKYRRGYI